MEVVSIDKLLNKFIVNLCRPVGLQLIIALLLIIPQALAITDSEDAEVDSHPMFWTSNAHYSWIGEESILPGNLSITINENPVGKNKISINYYDGIPHVQLPLEYGSANKISIKNGITELFIADIFFAFTYQSRLVPDEYIYNPFHTEQQEGPCKVCHRLQVNDNDLSPAKPADNICYQCHRSKFTNVTYQHKAAGINWECLKCHQAEAFESNNNGDSLVKFSIKEGREVAPLCYNCHKDKQQQVEDYEYVHGPVAMEGCNMCHNPHGSNTEKLLQKDISTMCVECHELQSIMKMAVIHKPLSEKGCTGCHNPHGSNSVFFLEAEINNTCTKCHPKIPEYDHPIMGHPVSAEADPTMNYRSLSCTSCHNAHSSEHDKLLGEAEIMMVCAKCHPFGK